MYFDDLSGNTVIGQNSSTPQFVLSDMVLGHTYEVSVTAVNDIGEGVKSTALTVYTGVAPSKMTGTSEPYLDSSTSTSITIRWLPPSYNGGAVLTSFEVHFDIG